ncbi:putative disease resistance protein RGA3 [Sesamum angolense]|uniref:Disease resistance protein RGA3 n=1 Tax=Sesamum angolense TaxID=2727404 RepID=A0AAE1T351_9LAMI|nr:putative disease resistance protein RGA3 [Sesamum angolense]
MAEIILTPLLQVIFEKLANPVLQKFADYWELEERFKKLQRILPIAKLLSRMQKRGKQQIKLKLSKQYNFKFHQNILDDLQKTAVEGLNLRLLESKIVDEQFDMRETSSFVIGSEKKKYLLVLDDVWNQDQEEWDKLRLLFSAGVDGSEEENNQRLLAVGKEIVRKCEGVPLAAKVLGGLMNFKREERDWLHVQHSELWDIGVYRKGIFPAMILSYCIYHFTSNIVLHFAQSFQKIMKSGGEINPHVDGTRFYPLRWWKQVTGRHRRRVF